jgi:hypothetical protein
MADARARNLGYPGYPQRPEGTQAEISPLQPFCVVDMAGTLFRGHADGDEIIIEIVNLRRVKRYASVNTCTLAPAFLTSSFHPPN